MISIENKVNSKFIFHFIVVVFLSLFLENKLHSKYKCGGGKRVCNHYCIYCIYTVISYYF